MKILELTKDNIILASEVNNIKQRIKTECDRRQYQGSVASLGGPAHDIEAIQNEIVLYKIFEETVGLLKQINNNSFKNYTEAKSSIIKEWNTLSNQLIVLEQAGMKSQSLEATGCAASCTGLCFSTCSDSCAQSGCAAGCGSGCASTCTGGCKTTCTGGCNITCKESCEGQCTSCQGTCSEWCKETCDVSCKDGCNSSCKGKCTGSCEGGCSGNCEGGCYPGCNAGCYAYSQAACGGGAECTQTCHMTAWIGSQYGK